MKNKNDPINKNAYDHNQSINYDALRFSTDSGKIIHEMELSKLLTYISSTSISSDILEIGCGTGRLLLELIDRDLDVTGVDASNFMLDELKKKMINKKIKPKLYNFEAINIMINKKYHFIYSIRLLNQTGSTDYALNSIIEMFRISKPNGYILLEFVNTFRPRIGRNATNTVRLSHNMICNFLNEEGAHFEIIEKSGLFFFGMGSYDKVPSILLNFFKSIDLFFSNLFPKFCARGYLFLKKIN